ncbi:transport and Golgi organization protein 11-like [Limulus polyphemus]|uniref:Mitochondrial fission factor n=1 Tax=Limulus polyphemus TaxID=6850 RepID=A0ABM1SAE6_LIMPO|nr:transport and Golgi organization protein 11-like [Limulus polyphemus]XP_022240598.1 transport and Golgi organization protein 11-like [Limulus polyphemus]XP_022240599.1 transport and Golgi organization protein 11-like [Limulus polyphemus]XP_022240600.1 transport and Golgi organization protein 11-like [Limulus polyphemus]XP_022240601.1 transport and Golgi organization protein 11-like [Limulus polyphemus]
MSQGENLEHRFSGSFDSFYDHDFTAEINTKMTVPQKISFMEEPLTTVNQPVTVDDPKNLFMHVPERILVVGGNHHVEGREPFPEMNIECSFLDEQKSDVHLNTPPHTLTLGEHHFPTIFEEESGGTQQKNHNGQIDIDIFPKKLAHSRFHLPFSQPSDGLAIKETEEEVALLRNQVRHLSRRMLAVEQENQQKQQREIILYAMSALYFLLKGILWLHRHW